MKRIINKLPMIVPFGAEYIKPLSINGNVITVAYFRENKEYITNKISLASSVISRDNYRKIITEVSKKDEDPFQTLTDTSVVKSPEKDKRRKDQNKKTDLPHGRHMTELEKMWMKSYKEPNIIDRPDADKPDYGKFKVSNKTTHKGKLKGKTKQTEGYNNAPGMSLNNLINTTDNIVDYLYDYGEQTHGYPHKFENVINNLIEFRNILLNNVKKNNTTVMTFEDFNLYLNKTADTNNYNKIVQLFKESLIKSGGNIAKMWAKRLHIREENKLVSSILKVLENNNNNNVNFKSNPPLPKIGLDKKSIKESRINKLFPTIELVKIFNKALNALHDRSEADEESVGTSISSNGNYHKEMLAFTLLNRQLKKYNSENIIEISYSMFKDILNNINLKLAVSYHNVGSLFVLFGNALENFGANKYMLWAHTLQNMNEELKKINTRRTFNESSDSDLYAWRSILGALYSAGLEKDKIISIQQSLAGKAVMGHGKIGEAFPDTDKLEKDFAPDDEDESENIPDDNFEMPDRDHDYDMDNDIEGPDFSSSMDNNDEGETENNEIKVGMDKNTMDVNLETIPEHDLETVENLPKGTKINIITLSNNNVTKIIPAEVLNVTKDGEQINAIVNVNNQKAKLPVFKTPNTAILRRGKSSNMFYYIKN